MTMPAPAPLHRQAPVREGSRPQRNPRLLALGFGAILLVPLAYAETAQSIVAIWSRSGTFAHCYLILPISAGLIWRRRQHLAQLPVANCWPAAAAIALCGALWLLATLGDVPVVRQYMFACMLVLAVPAVFGMGIARAIAFPLLFVLFAVPAGETLINPLIELTASFTVDALRLSGIPVVREGNNFSIPTGDWSVVEACSGLRYLISSVTLGSLYAYLTYRSWRRRAVFILASMVLPVVANGLRAYMIVMIGHSSGMQLAVGIDHVLYGWLFFGMLMAALFWIGRFWQQADQAPPADAAPRPQSSHRAPQALAVACTALAIAAWPAYAWQLQHRQSAPPVAQLNALPPAYPLAAPFTKWMPAFGPASATLRQFHSTPRPAGLLVYYYRDGGKGRLISSINKLTGQRAAWHETSTAYRAERIGGSTLPIREVTIAGQDRLLAWQWYDVGGTLEAGDYRAKLQQMRLRLQAGHGDGAIVVAFTALDEDRAAARAVLRSLLLTQLEALRAAVRANDRP
jgi:exosortase A